MQAERPTAYLGSMYSTALLRTSAALLALSAIALGFGRAQENSQPAPPDVTIAPRSSARVTAEVIDPANEPALTAAQKLELIRRRIKYVFVLFQENRSFDFYFATYPGADGIYAGPAGPRSPDQIAGYTQTLVNTDGTLTTVTPFRIPATIIDVNGKTVPLYPADVASVNHSHVSIARKIALDQNGVAENTEYSLSEEGVTVKDGTPSKAPSLERKQFGELVMAHVDCDTAPFLWRYADRFTLFDHFMDTIIGPSTPNAIALISGQGGETQWMLHPEEATTGGKGKAAVVPVVSDPEPYWGSPLDTADRLKQPEAVHPSGGVSKNLTFASLPLSFMGSAIKQTTAADFDPAFDLPDVHEDIEKIAGHGVKAVNWGWFQQGYDHEINDAAGKASHEGYVAHHNAPQYFGYVANNPIVSAHMHGLSEFFATIAHHDLPSSGVFYIRGGYGNIDGWKPEDPNPKLAQVFSGNDDHPGYSDTQISEGLLAKEINAIAASPYWPESAIIITYDESDGFYDHTRPRIRSHDASGLPLEQGPRVPAIVISPFSVAHGLSHVPSEHSSIIKFVDELFGLVPLADLPDEERARQIGAEKFDQPNLGPADDKVPDVGDMTSAFDALRLEGKRAPLSAAYATIPPAEVQRFPHEGGNGCRALEITPTDHALPNPVPADFNPRPDTTPGIPTSGNWTP